ncbi:MAG: restriction endonuclease subunit S [Methylovulum sp.]|uniref:restriction endonuclease subunit S n=1 Tax=Methylovulum sp. TaxID=1916980 RepID=UPI002630559A|nr:restriction endonuclease subunit S [Methylovulum sp.]MDD2723424.1 restriction endonuclease subunit S [Methylovulum sp.]MDD5125586.1 restriction endonuclease subunit S [Methylovulum sp.]
MVKNKNETEADVAENVMLGFTNTTYAPELIWQKMTLKNAGVSLIDCDHRTPSHADEGYPYIAIPQLKNGHITLEGVRLISKSDYLDWTKKLKPQEDDVIVVRRCNSGDSAVVPRGLECAIGQNLVILRADGTTVNPKFLRWLIRGPGWWEQVKKYINVGAVFDSLKCREIPQYELLIPPLVHQKEIATILGALDDRITLLRETNTTLEAIAQALFKSWFVDFDPVHAKQQGREPEGMDAATAALFPDSFEESELGLMPDGWKLSTVQESFILTMGQSPPGHTYNESGEGIPFYQGRTDFGFRFPTQRIFCTAPTRLAEFGDVLVSVRAPVGDVNMAMEKCCLGRGVAGLRHSKNYKSFAFYTARGLQTRFHLFNSEGTVFGSINKKDFQGLPVIKPTPDVMQIFDEIASPLDSKIIENEKQIRTLTTLRDTLLPRLISGQLRLPDAEAMLEETT